MISINISELIWTVINFFLLLFLLNRFLEKARSREEAKKLLALNAEEIEKHNAEVLQEAKKASVQNRKDSEAALSQRQEKTAQQLHEAAPELAAMLAEKLLSEE